MTSCQCCVGKFTRFSLAERYAHAEELGGFRPTSAESPNMGWRNKSFRCYADYLQTPEFAENLSWVMILAEQQRIALMCAEAVPRRCHRSLIADALVVHGIAAEEIVSPTRLQPHRLTPFARVDGQDITYPPYETETSEAKARWNRRHDACPPD